MNSPLFSKLPISASNTNKKILSFDLYQLKSKYYLVDEYLNVVLSCTILSDHTVPSIFVDKNHQRTGIATAMYMWFLDKFKYFISDYYHTDGSKMTYKSLLFKYKKSGYAIDENNKILFKINTETDFETCYEEENIRILIRR
jgi:hypothetical protein